MTDTFAAPRPSPFVEHVYQEALAAMRECVGRAPAFFFTEDTALGVVAIWEGRPGGKLWGLMTPEQFAELKRRAAREGL